MVINDKIEIVDTTLRDGEQAAGVAFGIDDKVELAGKLTDLGISELEIGTAACDGPELNAMRAILTMGLPNRLTLWARANMNDLRKAISLKCEAIHISLPVSDILLSALNKNTQWLMEQIDLLLPVACDNFKFVSIGLQDASRTSQTSIGNVCEKLRQTGVNRVRIADTVGIWDPFLACETINQLKNRFPELPLGFHAHNDLGMAVANSIAAIKGGCKFIDVTVNGLGERTGNAPLEEVVMAALISLKLDLGIDTAKLYDISQLVARLSGRPIPLQKPIIGNCAFLHESGIHVHAMIRNEQSYEPFPPETVGRQRDDFIIGKHSGRAALQIMLDRWGLPLPSDSQNQLMAMIKLTAATQRRALTRDEITILCGQLES